MANCTCGFDMRYSKEHLATCPRFISGNNHGMTGREDKTYESPTESYEDEAPQNYIQNEDIELLTAIEEDINHGKENN